MLLRQLKIFPGNDTSVIVNQSVQLAALDINNSGFDSYSWSPPFGLNNPYAQNPVAMISSDITYTVTATTSEGCEGKGSISFKTYPVSDIFVPNAFTPNGDGPNDVLKAIPIGIKSFKYFAVYNRWGQMIFKTTSQGSGWDGTINGLPQQTGGFVWMAEGVDYKDATIHKNGSVLLIR